MSLFKSKQAYPGRRSNAYSADPNLLTVIGLDTPHKEGEHELYDPRIHLPLDEEFVANVLEVGVLEPVLVWKIGTGDDAIFAVADGRQRTRVLRKANELLVADGQPPLEITFVPVKGKLTPLDLALLSVSANVHIPDPPLVKAKRAELLLRRGASKSKVARHFAVTERTVDNWLKLLDAPEEVQEAVVIGDVTQTDAREIAALPALQQQPALEQRRKARQNGNGRIKRGPNIRGKIRAVLDCDREHRTLNRNHRKLLQWFAGEIGDDDVRQLLPGLPDADD